MCFSLLITDIHSLHLIRNLRHSGSVSEFHTFQLMFENEFAGYGTLNKAITIHVIYYKRLYGLVVYDLVHLINLIHAMHVMITPLNIWELQPEIR